jgi:N-acetylneuraminic acid mutarotase
MKKSVCLAMAAVIAGCSTGPMNPPTDGAAGDAAGDARMCGPGSAMQPQARGDSVGAVDPATGLLYVFGGDVGPTVMCIPSPMFRNDTWSYDADCDVWRPIETPTAPSARARAAYATDTRRRRLIVFGGRFRAGTSGNYTLYNDVWAFDFETKTWAQIEAPGGPTPRANAAAAYDPTADELLVHGGNTSASGASFQPQGDLWALNLETRVWRRVTTMGAAPSARLFHGATVSNGALWLLGGGGANAFQGPFYTEVFRLDLATSTWSTVLDSNPEIVGRINPAIVPDGDGVLLLGGHDDGALGNRNDAIGISAAGAVTVHVAGDQLDQAPAGFCDFPANFVTPQADTPERRSAAVVAADPTRNRVVIFGGKTDCGVASDVWLFNVATHRWQLSRGTNDGMSCARQNRSNCSTLCN